MSGTPITTEHLDALLRRARRGSAIKGASDETKNWWKGYTKGLEDLLSGEGAGLAARDAALAAKTPPGRRQSDQRRPFGVEVWHLLGDQGTGKSFYLQHLSKAIGRPPYHREPIVEIESWELGQTNGRIDLALEDYGACRIVAITYNNVAEGQTPTYWMMGDRIMSFPKGVKLDVIAANARNDAVLFAGRQAEGGAA